MSTAPADIDALMRVAPVIPVLVIHELAHARPIAEALVVGGLPVIEVTLRTPVATEVISEMSAVKGAIVGAGTVLSDRDLERSVVAGARFIVAPGLTDRLTDAAITSGVPYLPGVATAADIMRGLDKGLNRFKFFPAEAAGGLPALRALSAPFADVRFCPTGGITAETASSWLATPSVLCVGGSWLVPGGTPDVAAIEATARRAAETSRP